jgi:hypothetical protein
MEQTSARIAETIDLQGARVRDIVTGVSGVSRSTDVALDALERTNGVAHDARGTSEQVREAASAIGAQCATINGELDRFLAKVDRRAAPQAA